MMEIRCYSCTRMIHTPRQDQGKTPPQCRGCKKFGCVMSWEEYEAMRTWKFGDSWPPLASMADTVPDLVVPMTLTDLPTLAHQIAKGFRRGASSM